MESGVAGIEIVHHLSRRMPGVVSKEFVRSSALTLEALESRLLLSADGQVVPAPPASGSPAAMMAETVPSNPAPAEPVTGPLEFVAANWALDASEVLFAGIDAASIPGASSDSASVEDSSESSLELAFRPENGLPATIDPNAATRILPAPGRLSLEPESTSAGLAGLWKFAVPSTAAGGRMVAEFRLSGVAMLPTNVAVGWYDESGNRIGAADQGGASLALSEESEPVTLEAGRTYFVAVHASRALPDGAARLDLVLRDAVPGAEVRTDARTGAAAVSFLGLAQVFQSPSDLRWHPLSLLNLGDQARISVAAETAGREVDVWLFERTASLQLLGSGDAAPTYSLVAQASSTASTPATLNLKAPAGSTLGEREYLVAVAPRNYAGSASGYRVEVQPLTPVVVPAALSAAEVSGNQAFALQPTLVSGVGEATFRNQNAVGDTARYFSFRAPATGPVAIRVDAGFDAVVSLYNANRALLEVATESRNGVVTLRADIGSSDLHYVRVANGPGTSPREGTGFSVELAVTTAPRTLSLPAFSATGVAVENSGGTINVFPSGPAGFFELRPPVGADVVTLRLQTVSSVSLRVAAVSVDGTYDRTFATGVNPVVLLPVLTQGAPIQIVVAATGVAGTGPLLSYSALRLPRELAIGSLPGRALSSVTGNTETTVAGFDRSGDSAGFQFHQGLAVPSADAAWVAQGSGGATPILARYEAAGSVLRLVDWTAPDANGRSAMAFEIAGDRLYAAVAYQPLFQNGGAVALSVDHPAPLPVGVGMVPDLAYEDAHPGKYGYILQIRGVTLEHAYETDYWQTLLPDRFHPGNIAEDPAWPVLEVRPDTPGSELRLRVTLQDGNGAPLVRWNGDTVLPVQAGADGVIRVDFASLGVFRQTLEGRALRFRVEVVNGALGDGAYTLRLTVRTPNPHPYEITEARWTFPGGEIPAAITGVTPLPSGTQVVNLLQDPSGEGSANGQFTSSAPGVHLYRFWTPSQGSFRVWTEGRGDDPANTTIKLYRARYAVTRDAERTSWWEQIDYLEELPLVGPNTDWYPADRSVIDAQVWIEDPEFPAYKRPTDDLNDATVGQPTEASLDTPYLPADRQFSDQQDVYFVVVKNEQGSVGQYRLKVSTEDLPRLQSNPVGLAQRPNAQNMRTEVTVTVPDVERYGQRIGVYSVQLPEHHSGYFGVSGEPGASWRFAVYGPDGDLLDVAVETNGERRYLVPLGTQIVRVVVLELGRNTGNEARVTFAATLVDDAEVPSSLATLGLDNIAQTLLPTNPWGALGAGDFTAGVPIDSSGRLYRFRAPAGELKIALPPIAGSNVSFLWGLYEEGRLVAWDRAIPGQPNTYTATIGVGSRVGTEAARTDRAYVLYVRHSSGSVQPAQFGITLDPVVPATFVASASGVRTSVPLPALAREISEPLSVTGTTEVIEDLAFFLDSDPDQWMRFVVPDGPGATVRIVGLPTSATRYPLVYTVYDASGRDLVVTGTQAFSDPAPEIPLPQLEPGKAYIIRLAPRDQPLIENVGIYLRFRPAKAAQAGGEFIHSVPPESPPRPNAFDLAFPDFRGDFTLATNLEGSATRWWQFSLDRPGPVSLEAAFTGSADTRVAIYRDNGSGEFPSVALVDFANEHGVVPTPEGRTLHLDTFLGEGAYFLAVSRGNAAAGTVRLEFQGPEQDVERLQADPNSGVTLRSLVGRATGTQFFDIVAPAGSLGPAIFQAIDLDLLDGRPQIERIDTTQSPPRVIPAELTLKARLVVWAVPDDPSGALVPLLSAELGREPGVARSTIEKATLTTPGTARPFQRYVIGIQLLGYGLGYQDEVSGRSKSIGIQVVFEVPNSGSPDLTVESLRLLPNNGQTLVEVTVYNRGYAVALDSQSRFTYPTLDASQPVSALVDEGILGPQTRRVRLLDWVNPVSPDDVTRYLLDAASSLEEIDETNNAAQEVMRTVNAARPVLSVSLNSGLDGNADPSVWGRYLDSRGHGTLKVLADIALEASDPDDAANTFDNGQEIYLLRSDSPLPYTSANHYLRNDKVIERIEISALAPTGPGTPNQFAAYAVDRFGLRSETVRRTIQVVPVPKWMDAGDTEIAFDRDTRQYQLRFSARPVDYAATLSRMLDANIPLVGGLQNQFFIEAVAERAFSLDPSAPIAPIQPSIQIQATVLGQDILDRAFLAGTSTGHVNVLGHIDVRPDTLEAGDFELTARIDQYPVDRWEGPEIPLFGFDAAIVSAAVQAQVIVDLKFDAALTFVFDLTQAEAPLRITSPSYVGLDLRVELRFEGEVEVAGFLDIASVGGGFFFTLKPRYGLEDLPGSIAFEDFVDQSCLGLSATIGGELSADIFGFEVFSIELESDEIQLTNCDVATSMEPGANALTGTTGIPLPGTGSLLQSASNPLPNDKYVRVTQRLLPGTAVMPAIDVRPGPQLLVDPATGERLLVYLDTPSAGAPPVLYAARGTATAFSDPVPLASAEWMSRPILAATHDGPGLRAVVVYQTAPNPTPETTRNGFLVGQDLKYRYFDGTAWSEELALTDNAFLDWQASLAFNAAGDGAVAWIQKSVAAPIDARGQFTGTDRLFVARWDKVAHRWLAPSQVGGLSIQNQPAVAVAADGVIGVAARQLSGSNSAIVLARRATNGTWTVDTLADGALPADGRFRSIALGIEADGRWTFVGAFTERRVANAPVSTRVLARTGTFDDLRNRAMAFDVVAVTGGVSSLQSLRAADGSLVIGWQERRGTFSDVVVSRRAADGSWTRPARVTQGSGDERAVRLALDGSGAVISVFERGVHFFAGPGGALVPGDGPRLPVPASAPNRIGTGLAVAGPELSLDGPLLLDGVPGDDRPVGLAGSTAVASVWVRNTGATTAEAVVTLYDQKVIDLSGRGEVIGERRVRIAPGGRVQVSWDIEVALGTRRFLAEAVLVAGVETFNRRDAVAEGTLLGRIDLAVEALGLAESVGGVSPRTGKPVGGQFEVVNRSGIAYVGEIRVVSFWEDPAKPDVRTVVQVNTLSLDLAPGGRRPLLAPFTFETAGLRLVGLEISGVRGTELSTLNNQATIPVDLRPDVALVPVEIEVRDRPVGTAPALSIDVLNFSGVANAELKVRVSNTGQAPVTAFTLRLAHSVEGGAFTELLTQTVAVEIPVGEYREIGFKVPALAGENRYRAEVSLPVAALPAGLPERVTANNVAETSVVVQGLPDLTVASVSVLSGSANPPALRVGSAVNVDVRVDNLGIAAAKGARVEIFALSRGMSGEGIFLGVGTLGSVPALGSATLRIALDTSLLPLDANVLRVVVDRHQRLLETTDLNNELSRPITVVAPVFTSTGGYLNAGSGQLSKVDSLSVTFNRDVVLPRDVSVMTIQNVVTGEFLDSSKFTLELGATARTLTWRFNGLPGGVLPAGEYVARIAAGAFADRASTASLGRDFVMKFTVSPGDANGDGRTNERDYLLLWRELRKPEASRSVAFDLDGDGKVTSTDLDLIRSRLGARGATPGNGAPLPP